MNNIIVYEAELYDGLIFLTIYENATFLQHLSPLD